MFVGRLVELKGVHHLLKASKLVTRPHQLWIVGDGPQRASLVQLAAELGIQDRTRFFGALGPVEIHRMRMQSHVQVVTSLWAEVFGMVGPEAFLAGCPVVAYASGGITEWAIEGQTAKLVPTGDIPALARRIEEVLINPAEALELAENGRRLAQTWSVEQQAQNLSAVYAELVSQSSETATAK
jgi:colanic acid/amylovoran biosynthesis glycosyltransferase